MRFCFVFVVDRFFAVGGFHAFVTGLARSFNFGRPLQSFYFIFVIFFFWGSSLTGFSPAFTRRRCWPRSSWRAAFRLRPPPIDGQSEPFTDSERVLPGFTGFGKSLERVLLDFTEFYWVFKGLHYVLLLLAGVLLGFIGFYRVLSILQSFTWF